MARRRGRTKRAFAYTASTLAVGSVLTVCAVGMGAGATPAFAVEDSADGIVVTVNRLNDAKELEKALADRGVDAQVDYSTSSTFFHRTGGEGDLSYGIEQRPVDASVPSGETSSNAGACAAGAVNSPTITRVGTGTRISIPHEVAAKKTKLVIGTYDDKNVTGIDVAWEHDGSICHAGMQG